VAYQEEMLEYERLKAVDPLDVGDPKAVQL
jgi:hypothetical protein